MSVIITDGLRVFAQSVPRKMPDIRPLMTVPSAFLPIYY